MLTDEQQAVVQSKSDALGVFAFAGAGKTTTLKAYAEARPNERILYLAFNTAIKEEAKKKFPKNVECHTTHSLAYMHEGREYRHKLISSGNIRPDVIAKVLGLDFYNQKSFRKAQQAQSLLNRFLLSVHKSFDDFASQFKSGEQSLDLEAACKLWEAMVDKSNDIMPMLHDGYLKLFQVKSPSLDWDIILFDEAQDANPVTLEIIRNQNARKVFVGDPHQQIYSFRGVVNAMHDPVIKDRLYLTETFRFGAELADIANGILEIKRESKKIIGRGIKPPSNTRAFISRGNASLYNRAVSCLKNNEGFHFIGGIDGIQLNMLLDIYSLWMGDHAAIKDNYIKKFKYFDHFKMRAESNNDRDILAWCNVLEKHDNISNIPLEVKELKRLHHATPVVGDLVLTTTHKSKGLEFGVVTLARDFPSAEMIMEPPEKTRGDGYPDVWEYGPKKYPELWNKNGFRMPIIMPNEEVNLRYVAVTRAEKEVRMDGSNLTPFVQQKDWLRRHSNFLWLESKVELGRLDVSRRGAEKTQIASGGISSGVQAEQLSDKIERIYSSYGWALVDVDPGRVRYAIAEAKKKEPNYDWEAVSFLSDSAFRSWSDLPEFVLRLHSIYSWDFHRKTFLEFLVNARFIKKS